MCGIAGRVNLEAPVDRAELFRMTAAIAHRGPDDRGYHLRDRVGLGHRRLSIVDLSGGRQPLANEDETVWITYNGEVYNHLELRRELAARGHRFRTRSDTEAIVHAYEEWGARSVERLRGMFAWAIWDERSRTLTLARDRLGIKPLYYAELGGDLVFASELKALLEAPELEPVIDETALAAYLALRYVPAPLTLLRGVRKLEPGTLLRWRDGGVRLERYWDLADLEPRPAPPTEVEAAYELRELIDEAVALRLMGEVPVGAFLSGGLDSTVVTEAMLRAADRRGPLKTFSVGYAGAGTAADDELAWARRAARALGTEHREVRVSAADVRDHLPKIVWHLDEPVADPACVPLWFLARRAREEVTVVLSGEGADEILAGYAIYRRRLVAERLIGAAGAPLGQLARLAGHLPSPRLRRAAALLDAPIALGYRGVARALDGAACQAVCAGFDARAVDRLLAPHRRAARALSPLARMLYLDHRVWLPDDLLVKADKMTMAHALELRVPLLDHRLVEHAWSLPDRLKVRGAVGKAILRRAARDRIPREILTRRKQGFATPAGTWLRSGLSELASDALFATRSFARARFDLSAVASLLARHQAGADHAAELWPLLVLELWHGGVVAPARRRPAGHPPECSSEMVHAAS